MAIAINNLGTSANPDITTGTNATSYSNSSWTPPTTGIICVFISTRSAGAITDPTVTGNSLTWVLVNREDDGSDDAIWLFAAIATPASTGATTIDFGGVTQTGIHAHFFQITGANTRRTNGLLDTFKNFQTTAGTTGTSNSMTLDAAEHSDNRPLSAHFHSAAEGTNFRTNWTELDDNTHGVPNSGFETQWRSDTFETTASATWASSANRLGFACEIVSDTAPTAFTKTITDTEGITDTRSKTDDFVRTVTTTEAISDLVSKVAGFVRTIADSVGITDLVTTEYTPGTPSGTNWTKTITDIVGITDSISRVVDYSRTLVTVEGISDSVNRTVDYSRAITDTVGITDNLISGIVHINRTLLIGSRSLVNSLLGKKETNNLYGSKDDSSLNGKI